MEVPSTKKEKVIIIPRPPCSENTEAAPGEATETVEAEEVGNPSAPANPVASEAAPKNSPAAGGACASDKAK